jgi:hypothetical protein
VTADGGVATLDGGSTLLHVARREKFTILSMG